MPSGFLKLTSIFLDFFYNVTRVKSGTEHVVNQNDTNSASFYNTVYCVTTWDNAQCTSSFNNDWKQL